MRFVPVITLFAFLARAAGAEPIDVDVELALMVDASRSMGPKELRIQRRGYAEGSLATRSWTPS